MIPLLTEHFWVWLAIAGFFLTIGVIFLSQTGEWKGFLLFGGLAILLLAVGGYLTFVLKTDRKEIKKTIYELADAVRRNDLPEILNRLDEGATKTAAKANYHLKLAKIDKTKLNTFTVKTVNRFTSPPTAIVAFNAWVEGTAGLQGLNYPFSIPIRFEEVELVKGEDGIWRVTDRCQFSYPGYNGEREF